jgi:Protein of unknown function (DUF2442)
MTILAEAIRFDDNSLWVDLNDGRTLGVPLVWFPRLLNATPEQRTMVEISYGGLHWAELDEDISIAGLLAGRGDVSRPEGVAA